MNDVASTAVMDGALPAVADVSTDLTNYSPQKGLKTIAVSEAAEKMFQRAKDHEMLFDAITTKLAEQRRFVMWWDEQEKHPGNKGAGRGNVRPSQTDDSLTLEQLGLDNDTVYRWRKRLKDPNKYDIAVQAAQERCRRVVEMEKGSTDQKGASGTGENEWYTPDQFLEAARDVLGTIDLDPASSDQAQEKVQAKRHLTIKDDGLAHEWNGTVWLNPPYAQPHIADFVSKMVAERRAGRVTAGIMLTHNYTDTTWFHEAAGLADAICFTRGRIRFYDNNGTLASPTQGQAFFYFGDDVDAFAARFSRVGFVTMPWVGEVAE